MSTDSDPFNLRDRVIVLTGGAGIYGRGIAAQLAAAGAVTVLASRQVAEIQAVADAEKARGHRVYFHPFDQGSEASIFALRDYVVNTFGQIDGLVNNAVARPVKDPQCDLAAWAESMRINATGLFATTRAFGEAMAARGSGSIVNIGSIQGMVGPDLTLYEGLGMQAVPDYFFHKGGMINLTRYFAALYGPSGVRVNCLSPGGFEKGQPAEFVDRYSRSTFLRRMATDGDLGGPVIFLLSSAARYVTGANLPVDGGYTAR